MRYLLVFLMLIAGCSKPVIHPHKGEIVEAVYGLGTVESDDVFYAKAAIISTVLEFYVREGEDVVKNQKLFKNDQGAIVYAPFAGRITDIPVAAHENLFPSTIILSLCNLEKLYLSVSLEQQGAMRIKKGLNAEISFEFFRNKKINGKIETIYPRKNEFVAKVRFEKNPEGVLPGMTADVAFEIDRKKDAVLVPAKALVNGNLIVSQNGKKNKYQAKVGLVDLEYAEILEPVLSLDDELIIP
jgi:multidrug efflux pump subunit AcrA (membrane-fusion protein)